jgi:predicted metal-dependent HD superfamily phosphohydrolase
VTSLCPSVSACFLDVVLDQPAPVRLLASKSLKFPICSSGLAEIIEMEVPNARWQDLCLKLDVPSSVGLAWFELMKKRYAEPWRFYHTMRHVEALLLGLAAEMSVVQCEEALLLAIFFHDLVYDPRSKTNEADSANLFKQFADEAKLNSRKQSLVESVVDMILQTANHMGVNVETASADKLVFLDLDLAILGSPNDAYSTYAKEIRKVKKMGFSCFFVFLFFWIERFGRSTFTFPTMTL